MYEQYGMGQYPFPWGGVYEVLANFTYVATVAGVQETQMFRNGNAVPGAHALDTVATVGDDVSPTRTSRSDGRWRARF